MSFANEDAFNDFRTRLTASGARQETVKWRGEDATFETNGGILGPQRVELAVGTRLIRFGDGSLAARALDGAWWLEWREHNRIVDYAQRNGMSVPDAMRRMCVLPLEWSDLSTLVQVRLTAPLLAYGGPGAPAQTKSGPMSALADALGAINQLYVPGLGTADARRASIVWEGQGYYETKALR